MCSLRKSSTGQVLDNPGSPSDVNSTEIVWTNEIGWQTADTIWNSQYKTEKPPDVAYVHTFRVGIVHAKTTLKHIHGKGWLFRITGSNWSFQNSCPCKLLKVKNVNMNNKLLSFFFLHLNHFFVTVDGREILLVKNFDDPSEKNPLQSPLVCNHTFNLQAHLPFSHNDTYVYIVDILQTLYFKRTQTRFDIKKLYFWFFLIKWLNCVFWLINMYLNLNVRNRVFEEISRCHVNKTRVSYLFTKNVK